MKDRDYQDKTMLPGKHGSYFVAPDSCDPFPADFWRGVDQDIDANVILIEDGTPSSRDEDRYDKAKYLAPRIFRLATDERELLSELGADGHAMIQALDALDEFSGP